MQGNDRDANRPGPGVDPEHDPSRDGGEGLDPGAANSPGPQQQPPIKQAQDDEPVAQAISKASSIEESLHHALSDLEHMLERQRAPGEHLGASAGLDGNPGARRTERSADRGIFDDRSEPYTIPLLDEVIIPGPQGRSPPPAAHVAESSVYDDDEPAMRKRLAERLASEIEVIMQDRLEAALDKAREEIRMQVRNHLDITLPEIVEELNQLRQRR